MLNIHELEKRHFNYKLKSYIPYVTIFFSITVIAGITFAFINMDDSSEDTVKIDIQNVPKKIAEVKEEVAVHKVIEQKTEKKPKIIEQKTEVLKQDFNDTVEVNKKITDTETVNKKLILAPAMNFIENINANASVTSTYKEPVQKEKITYTQQATVQVTQKPKQEQKQLLITQEKSSIQIKKNNTYNDIQHVIKRFKKNNNPALSLFIAKKYYELGEYKKSYNYALRTNEINNNIEASWIIFAKSLVKLDRKDMAIKTLRKYITHSDSNKAKILLDEISSGKLNAN